METPWKAKQSESFVPFQGKGGQVEYNVLFHKVEKLDEISSGTIFKNKGFAVFKDSVNGFVRRFHLSLKGEQPYALTKVDFESHKITVDYLLENEWCFGSNRGDFYYIGWEKILVHEKRLILHAACVETPYGGILFSGSSGIGKSTQANLWCCYAKSRLINGDKTILEKKQDGWKAYGSPYAGSSKCHVNDNCGVRAVVMLKQAKNCSIRKLSISEAFRRLYSQVTMNSWDYEFVLTVIDLLKNFIMDVETYELECTPDIDAIQVLQDELRKEKNSWN